MQRIEDVGKDVGQECPTYRVPDLPGVPAPPMEVSAPPEIALRLDFPPPSVYTKDMLTAGPMWYHRLRFSTDRPTP
jgi:hypothetical protein